MTQDLCCWTAPGTAVAVLGPLRGEPMRRKHEKARAGDNDRPPRSDKLRKMGQHSRPPRTRILSGTLR